MREAWLLGRDIVLAPSAAAGRLKGAGGWRAAALLYAAYLAAVIVFYRLKPAGFPAIAAAAPPRAADSILFWAWVHGVWGSALTAILIGLAGWFSWKFRTSRLGMAGLVFASSAMAAGPLLLVMLYADGRLGKPALAAAVLLLAGAMVPGGLARPRREWAPLAGLFLALSAVPLALLPLQALAALMRGAVLPAPWPAGGVRMDHVYVAVQYAGLLWSIGLGTLLLGRVEGLSTPRAFAALATAILNQEVLVFALYFLDVFPKEVLKALAF